MTDPDLTGLEYTKVKTALSRCAAKVKIAILDCCFSGRAIETLSADTLDLADSTDIRGVYTLTASDHLAHVVPLAEQKTACTSFTREFVKAVSEGVPGAGPYVTFQDLYPVLRRRLSAQNLPAPNQRGTDTVGSFPIARNTAARQELAIAGLPVEAHRQPTVVANGPTPADPTGTPVLSESVRAGRKHALIAVAIGIPALLLGSILLVTILLVNRAAGDPLDYSAVGQCLPYEGVELVACDDPRAFWEITGQSRDIDATVDDKGELTDIQAAYDLCGEDVGAPRPGELWTNWRTQYNSDGEVAMLLCFTALGNPDPESDARIPYIPDGGDCLAWIHGQRRRVDCCRM